MLIQKIVIRGEQQPPASVSRPPEDQTVLKKSYRIGASVRGGAEPHIIDLQPDDLLELEFEDNTLWFSNADHLAELYPEAVAQSRTADGAFELPTVLPSDGAERGIVGDIALKALNIFVKKQVQGKVHELATDLEKKQLQDYSGLFQLRRDFSFQEYVPTLTSTPHLLFLHGTASSTLGSFGGLIGTDIWTFIEQHYGQQVLTFQHETLTKNPLQNAFKLVEKLPNNFELHIISHSRGGLVGDILSRFSHSDNERYRGFDDNEIAYLEKTSRQNDIEWIIRLQEALHNKRITVSKFVRVACPASGTTLASKRLDTLLNVTMNLVGYGTGVGANPFYAGFKNLIAAAIDSKNEVDVLPGLEAMNPRSPFIKVLNSPATQVLVNSPVHVVSGNCKIKPDLKALLIIVSKLFYLEDNDLVVNTHAMYQGAKRADTLVQYFFDEIGEVDHFNYFKNERTRKAIQAALAARPDTLAPGFSQMLQESIVSGDRQAWTEREDGRLYTDTVTGEKPIVVLLPGIMGSNLSKGNKELWINYWRMLWGKLISLDIDNEGVEALSVVKTSYGALKRYLSEKYDVVVFPFDWRKSLTDTASLFNDKIQALLTENQPIKIIAHSMGGVMIRDFILQHPATWQKLNRSSGFRLLFLGSPLGGSFRIPAVLCGRDAIINKLSRVDIIHDEKELIEVFSKFPGLLNLLPLTTDPDNDFAKLSTWKKLSAPLGAWPLPQENDLHQFQQYRETTLKGLDQIDYSNMVYIAGKDTSTPCGYRVEETSTGEKELVFVSTGEGDQSVTWDSGIPRKMIENGTVYYVPVTHGALANEPKIFGGIGELLAQGVTHSLSKNRPMVRSQEKRFRAPETYDFDLSPQGVEKTILGLTSQSTPLATELPMRVSVSNGDLRYARYPVLAGHFLHDGILYAEKAIDQYLHGALAERHQLGLYPGEVGTSELLTSSEEFKGAIIVGLGKFGALTAFQLTQTVEQGVTRYLLSRTSGLSADRYSGASSERIGLSSLVIACGYGGLTIESSVRAIIQGVVNANHKLKKLHGEGMRGVEVIEFIELYEDSALGCFYSLRKIENDENKSLHISVSPRRIRSLLGSRKRLPTEASENWWKKLTVQLVHRKDGADTIRCLQFSASTGGAREEQRELYSSTAIVEQLIDQISTDRQWTPALARTVYELLIPNDFKEELKKQGNINWILDKYTASYPWELLQDSAMNAKPLCVNAGMIRQLTTQEYRVRIKAVVQNNALVIGDPNLKGFIGQLPGALEEGRRVSEILTRNGYGTTAVLQGHPSEIVPALFSADYKVIHLAGHGVFDEKSPESSGMVIGENVFLSTREICQMSTVPELVFVNCCHLGKTDGVAEAYYRNRYKLAANIGVQLIENGVKAVVVAGWAVDDAAAQDFASVFYEGMFAGYTFGEAVQRARKVVYTKHTSNTWGAYQCYGDPFYQFRNTWKDEAPYQPEFVIAEQAEIELDNLSNKIETGQYEQDDLMRQLLALSEAVDAADIRNATITGLEALIYANMCEYDKAVAKFESTLAMEEASFTVSTLERYCNIRAKKHVRDFFTLQPRPTDSVAKMNQVIGDLEKLLAISPTAERHSLLGSALKRKALVYTSKKQKMANYVKAAAHYRQAHLGRKNGYSAYSVTNWLEIESVLVLAGERHWGKTVPSKKADYSLPTRIEATQQLNDALEALTTPSDAMDYWGLVAVASLRLCLVIVHHEGDDSYQDDDEIFFLFKNLWHKAGSRGKKVAKIEHLELLLDALSLVKPGKVDTLIEKVESLKGELNRLL